MTESSKCPRSRKWEERRKLPHIELTDSTSQMTNRFYSPQENWNQWVKKEGKKSGKRGSISLAADLYYDLCFLWLKLHPCVKVFFFTFELGFIFTVVKTSEWITIQSPGPGMLKGLSHVLDLRSPFSLLLLTGTAVGQKVYSFNRVLYLWWWQR